MDDFLSLFLLCVVYASDPGALGPRVLLVGDSNVGTGLVAGLSRMASLRPSPWELTPVSVSGSGIRHQEFWIPHLRARVASNEPELVVINLGTNDACDAEFGEHWLQLPGQALNLLREIPTSTPVVVVGVPPDMTCLDGATPFGPVDWINLWVWQGALSAWGGNARFVMPPPGLLLNEGEEGQPPLFVHYTDLGGRQVAAMVYDAASELLGEMQTP